MKITLTRGFEGGGPTIQVMLERSRPDATMRVSIDGEVTSGSISYPDLKALEAAIQGASIEMFPEGTFFGLADSTTLTMESGTTNLAVHWAGPLPKNWAAVGPIVHELLSLARTLQPSYALR